MMWVLYTAAKLPTMACIPTNDSTVFTCLGCIDAFPQMQKQFHDMIVCLKEPSRRAPTVQNHLTSENKSCLPESRPSPHVEPGDKVVNHKRPLLAASFRKHASFLASKKRSLRAGLRSFSSMGPTYFDSDNLYYKSFLETTQTWSHGVHPRN